MARPLPIEYLGAFCHVTARGHERKALFVDDPDRQTRTRRAKADYRLAAMRDKGGCPKYLSILGKKTKDDALLGSCGSTVIGDVLASLMV